jgi:glucokinase
VAAGVDIGATKFAAGLCDSIGRRLATARGPTGRGSAPAEVAERVAQAVEECERRCGRRAASVGVGIAAQVSPDGRMAVFSPNLRWNRVPLAAMLRRRLGRPVLLLNDVRAATIGEWMHGAGRACDDLVCLFIGTGVGGGVVSGGRLLVGANNTAGELGHVKVETPGRRCTCGAHGCLEAYVGGWALARRRTGAPPVRDAGRMLGQGLATIVNAFGPRIIVIGGGVAEALPGIAGVAARAMRAGSLPAAAKGVRVVRSALRGDAGWIGAAEAARPARVGR